MPGPTDQEKKRADLEWAKQQKEKEALDPKALDALEAEALLPPLPSSLLSKAAAEPPGATP